MPTYRYECPNGHTLEDFEPMSAPTERECPACNGIGTPPVFPRVQMKRVIGPGGGVLWKGGAPTRKFHR